MAAKNGPFICALDVSQPTEDPVAWAPDTLPEGPDLPPLKPVPQVLESGPEPSEQRKMPRMPTSKASEPTDIPPIGVDDTLEHMAARRPEEVGRIVRAMLTESGMEEQIAVLMIGLGATLAGRVIREFDDAEIGTITQAVASSKTISVDRKNEVFELVRQRMISGEFMLEGGPEFAHEMLRQAVGGRKAQAVMARIQGAAENWNALLRNLDPGQLVPFVAKEHPQAIALILSQLEPGQAAGILNGLPQDLQVDVVHRMACMDAISPETMRNLEHSLYDELQAVLTGQITQIGGPKAVAEILNRTGPNTERMVLEALDERDSKLAEDVRLQMFVFDDVCMLTDRDLKIVLEDVETTDLALALKGGKPETADRILKLLDNAHKEQILNIQNEHGPVRISRVAEAQLKVVQQVRQCEEAGQITVARDDVNDFIIE